MNDRGSAGFPEWKSSWPDVWAVKGISVSPGNGKKYGR